MKSVCLPLLAATLLPIGLRAESAPARVTIALAEKYNGIVREFTLTGSVSARRESRLSSRTEGLVQEVAVDEGSFVKPGDLLLSLDTQLAGIELELIEAEIAQAEIRLAEAIRREKEVEAVSRSGAFARSEAETRISERRIAETSLRQLEVRADRQQELIERHRLVAPFAGVISAKLSEAGEWVETGTPVLELVETEGTRFDIQVPQEFLTRLSAAENVIVVLDAFPDREIPATIRVKVPVKDPASRTFLTRLELEDPGNLAAPGMSGAATVRYRSRDESSVGVPRDAVVRYPDGSTKVWVIEGEGGAATVKSCGIRTGGTLGETTEVIEGLSGGERIVLRGNESLREGQSVQITAPIGDAVAPASE